MGQWGLIRTAIYPHNFHTVCIFDGSDSGDRNSRCTAFGGFVGWERFSSVGAGRDGFPSGAPKAVESRISPAGTQTGFGSGGRKMTFISVPVPTSLISSTAEPFLADFLGDSAVFTRSQHGLLLFSIRATVRPIWASPVQSGHGRRPQNSPDLGTQPSQNPSSAFLCS